MRIAPDQIDLLDRILRIGALGLTIAGVLLAALGISLCAAERGWTGRAERAVGTVVDLVRVPPGGRRMYPVVRFYTEAGQRLDVRSSRPTDDLRPGDIADVVWIRDGETWVRPRLIRVGVPPVLFVAGAAFVGLAVFLLASIERVNSFATR